ncbi:hypothetical protein LTR09_012433 [Extremus antarcticus]|uniref:CYTH domain-containing protein n=1 Tax=Extremus antarcticus TaxID=702011 RepID=A0AAJ0D4Y1_9PEZI|nr:hypothetical protein LTR09_012433 [Extremus antarcticus]
MRQAVLEVERKFCGLATPMLTANAGAPPFRSLQYLGEHSFKDIYFDKHEKLSSNGLWIRKRQLAGKEPEWEAKIRKGGTFNKSAFEELSDIAAIARYVVAITGQDEAATSDFGLKMVATLSTLRKSWLADGQFKIVLDSMDFGHEVGEVELEHELVLPQDPDFALEDERGKRMITQDMDRQIQAFMKRYHWAFRPGVPQGKLTAYFERQRSSSSMG